MSYKGILLFAAATIVLLLAFRYGLREVDTQPKQAPQKDPAEWAAWKEETFGDLGFSLRHPPDDATIAGAFTARKAGPYLAVVSSPRLTILIPKTRYKGTTFLDGYVTVSASEPSDGSMAAACGLLVRGGGGAQTMMKHETIGGTDFTQGGVSLGVGAVMAESLVYHAWFKNRCIEITANLFSINPRFASRSKQLDRIDAWKQLTDIVRTFRPATR
jgi:hypothetical protein